MRHFSLWLGLAVAVACPTAIAQQILPKFRPGFPLERPGKPATVAAPKVGLALPLSGFRNGGFEGELSPWVQEGTGQQYTAEGTNSHGGRGYIYLGYHASTSGRTYQQFTLPATAEGVLKIWLSVVSNEANTGRDFDTLKVEIRSPSGALLQMLGAFSNRNAKESVVYEPHDFDISRFKGQTIRLQFTSTNDAGLLTTFRIDDVLIR